MPVSAQSTGRTVTEGYEEAIKGAQTITALGPDLFGEQTNLQDGVTTFRQTDLEIRTNSGLRMAVDRTLGINARDAESALYGNELLGDWRLDVPAMHGIFDERTGWVVNRGNPQDRCSATMSSELAPPGVSSFTQGKSYNAEDYWSGNQINIPGKGSEPLLFLPSDRMRPSDGLNYHGVTKSDWRVACLNQLKRGSGEGFLVRLPDGTKYYFDWMASRPAAPIMHIQCGVIAGEPECSLEYVNLRRIEALLYATRVEDRFGNWVEYDYDPVNPLHLRKITSSDGVTMQFGYVNGRLDAVSAGGRTWSYRYANRGGTTQLSEVIRPDLSRWEFSTDNIYTSTRTDATALWAECVPTENVGSMTSGQQPIPDQRSAVTMTHPSGATGTFLFRMLVHGTRNTPGACYDPGPDVWGDEQVSVTPMAYHATSLYDKTIGGPGVAPQRWEYFYVPSWSWQSPSQCTSSPCTSQTRVTGPDQVVTRYTFGNDYARNAGQLLEIAAETSSGTVVRRTTNSYLASASGQPFPDRIGQDPFSRNNRLTTEALRPRFNTQIVQDGATFTNAIDTFDDFARPTRITRASSLGHSKTDVTEYHHDLSKWVLGQPKRHVNADTGLVMEQTDYHAATALPIRSSAFGKLQHTLGYWPDGLLANVTDGRGYTTELHAWKRGIPREIRHPDGTVQAASVDDNGWITAVTDENGYATGYGYDAMGRLASIVYPTNDTVGWNTTVQEFQQIGAEEYGIPAGHWRQIVTTGTGRKVAYFDALWRPLVEAKYDMADVDGTHSVSVKRYDSGGRLEFQSYPQRWISSYTATVPGVHTTYDALDRTTRVVQDSELGVLASTTEYLPGLQIRSTNARGLATTTGYRAYDQPGYDQPVWIVQPEGAITEIGRDVFGKPTLLRRRNGDYTQIADRHYVYDGFQQLCKTIEPETDTTVVDYDAAGNLAWSATGLSLPSTDRALCETDRWTAYGSGRRVSRTYDARNRPISLTFPNGMGSQSWTYTPDGLPAQITAYNDPGNGAPVVSAYTYNKRRLLTSEVQAQPSWYSWSIGYAYNANGSLTGQTYPSTGMYIDYAPNALGQPTRAGTYATNVRYHPNGGIASFNYGNGIVHTMSQNTRQLPARSTDSGGVLDHQYVYDPNANVQYIYDWRNPADHRYLYYDKLDRLTSAGSQMFQGDHWHRFSYDALDNLKSWTLGGVKDYAYYDYDTSNRLTNIRNSAGATIVGIGYDVQGNLANKNGQAYNFDYGNRLRSVTNKEHYRYDGQGRRVLAWSPTLGSILSQYTLSGQLLYQHDDRKGKGIEHVYLGGSLVATLDRNWAAGTTVTKYQHTDALGSPVAVTDAGGQVIERTNYEPYGNVIGGTPKDGPGYTGHVLDTATGLNYMQQRYYDPGIGRFLSVDPVTAYEKPGQNFNRYWYANDNPYRFTDPDGRLSYETKLRGQKLPVHIDDNLPMKEQKQLQTKVNAGIEKLNSAKLSKQETAVVQNVKSLDVSGTAERSFIQESTGALTFTADYVNKSSSTWLGSAVAHDGMHGELFKAGGVSLSRGLPAEVGAMKFQLRVGEKMGMSASDKSYLNNLISNPVLLKAYINTQP
ncbi:MAG: RHS repeat protein [Chloroflexota bacterium]|nr:RHS repeat protein [Chloroflexota bacterium]